jgi:SpoVK/Ycf46/Vps4 family AAA+-type ATPase
MVLATTSRPETIDSALLRPGRIEYHLLVPPPPLASRHELLRRALSKMPLSPELRAPSSHEPDPLLLDEFARTSGKLETVGHFCLYIRPLATLTNMWTSDSFSPLFPHVRTSKDFFFSSFSTLTHLRTSENFSLADLLDVCREAGKHVCVERDRDRERGSVNGCAFRLSLKPYSLFPCTK